MQALTYQGPHDVRVATVPDPILEAEDDLLLRVTATAICGADLHLYRGKVLGVEQGDVLGHEFMGVVEDVGRAVHGLRRGDRVVVPFTVSCGSCYFCERQLFAACETTHPEHEAILNKQHLRSGAGMFGVPRLVGGYAGGQAEFVRVPKANVGPLKLPAGVPDEQVLFLSDILPTGYQAALNAQIGPGHSVAIFGAGPVGCMAAASARLLGAERLFMVDHHAYRLDFAKDTYGATPVNFDSIDDPAAYIVEHTEYRGADASIDAIGFEAKGSTLETMMTHLKLEGSSGQALRWAIAATRRGGVISVPGTYAGFIHGFLFGDAFDKGLTLRTGQTHVQRFMPTLLEHILKGELTPHALITHRLSLSQAALGYELFDKKKEDCRKVVLTPDGHAAPPVTAASERSTAGWEKEAPG